MTQLLKASTEPTSMLRPLLPRAYRTLVRALSRRIAPLVFRRSPDWRWRDHLRVEAETNACAPQMTNGGGSASGSRRVVWFHAASAGELEMLWSVARALRARSEFAEARFALSVFSPSGRTRLDRFRTEFSAIYCGPSPWEGEWEEFFESFGALTGAAPEVFVTAKYECWPELWGALSARGIPLFLVNGEWRSSIRWGSRLTRWIFGRLPSVHFSAVSSEAAGILARAGGFGSVMTSGDPRWDQVAERLRSPQGRVRELREFAERARLPRPWVIVGSAWEEDLEVLLSAAGAGGFSGTLWMVPHRPCESQCAAWSERVQQRFPGSLLLAGGSHGGQDGAPPVLEPSAASSPRVVLVQEMGILAELYGIGDAAWVGGGFRTGLHSVIEPALSDLRIAAGACRAGGFPEVPGLVRLGQLELFENAGGAEGWLLKIFRRPSEAEIEGWRRWRSEMHLGASDRVARRVAEIVTAPARV